VLTLPEYKQRTSKNQGLNIKKKFIHNLSLTFGLLIATNLSTIVSSKRFWCRAAQGMVKSEEG
jgi:hypothetical protein